MTDKEKAKSIIPYQEKGYIFDEDLHEIYFHANGELMIKASVVEELKDKEKSREEENEKLKKCIERLKKQIKIMRNCENCRFAYDDNHDCMLCDDMKDWEMIE